MYTFYNKHLCKEPEAEIGKKDFFFRSTIFFNIPEINFYFGEVTKLLKRSEKERLLIKKSNRIFNCRAIFMQLLAAN